MNDSLNSKIFHLWFPHIKVNVFTFLDAWNLGLWLHKLQRFDILFSFQVICQWITHLWLLKLLHVLLRKVANLCSKETYEVVWDVIMPKTLTNLLVLLYSLVVVILTFLQTIKIQTVTHFLNCVGAYNFSHICYFTVK